MSLHRQNWLTNITSNPAIVMLAIGLLAILLRIYHLDFKSLWLDELYSIVPTNPQNSVDFIIQSSKADQPPLYFLLLHYWLKIFGYNSFSGRLLSAVIGVFCVFAMYFLGCEIKNRQIGLFASFLACINYFLIYYSQECRFYGLLFLLTVVSFIFFIRSLKHKTWINYGLYVVSTIALLYTQYFGILIFCIQGFVFLIFVYMFKPNLKFILTCIALAILISASFIPWLPTFIYDSQISTFWVQTPKPYFFVIYFYLYWGKDFVVSSIVVVVAILYLRYYAAILKTRETYPFEIFTGILLGSWVILSLLVPYIRSLISTPVLIPRYTLVTLPAVLVIIAMGFDLIRQQKIKIVVVMMVLTSSMINLFFVYKHYTRTDKAQWREAAHAVIAGYKPAVKVYSNQEWWYNFYFYDTEPRINVIGTYSSNEALEQQPFIDEIGNEKLFWVLSGEGIGGLNNMQQEYVNRYFIVKEQHSFYGASAILYEKKE